MNSIIGRRIIFVEESTSTNADLKRMAFELDEGSVLRAARQTCGRGRFDRSWYSDHQSLTFSVLLRPHLPVKFMPLLLIYPSVSLAKLLHSRQIPAGLKWPNDVKLGGRKIGGVLVENTVKDGKKNEVIIGIGLNVNQSESDFPLELAASAGSIFSATKNRLDQDELFHSIVKQLDQDYQDFILTHNFSQLIEQWLSFCTHLHDKVTVTINGQVCEGVFTGLSSTGKAILDINERSVLIHQFNHFEDKNAADY